VEAPTSGVKVARRHTSRPHQPTTPAEPHQPTSPADLTGQAVTNTAVNKLITLQTGHFPALVQPAN
jgi:hypothetical protein